MNTEDTYLNLSEMTLTIKTFLEKNGFTYKTIHNCNDIQILYHLIKNEDMKRVSKLSINVKYIAGLYFEVIHDVKSMMEQYLEGADLGCSECMNLLGRYYYRHKEYNQMLKFWEMSINKKNIEAIFNLGKFFEDEKQYDKMIHALKMAIDLGSEKAIQSLALYYEKNKEFEKMIEIYRQGAHNGYTSCMIELGNYYLNLGDTENHIKYYTAAAKTDPEAMYRLGAFYESKREYSKMIEYYSQALNHNHNQSMIRLGDYYKKIKNYDLMIHIYKMAAQATTGQTKSDAMTKLGVYYQKKKQFPEMMKYYEDAVKSGCVNAMNNLAIYYESIGDYEKMKMLLETAIQKKSSVAMYNMGLYYEKIKDYDKMAEYFMMSYQNGRVFDYSEIKLMKKSILNVKRPKLMNELRKMISDKKKKFKEIFSFKRSTPGSHKESKLKNQKSQYKLSKGESPKKNVESHTLKSTQNLIEIPMEEKPTKTLFTDMELYKIIGNMDQPQKIDWMMDLELTSNVACRQEEITTTEPKTTEHNPTEHSTETVLEPQMNSGTPNMYRMFSALQK